VAEMFVLRTLTWLCLVMAATIPVSDLTNDYPFFAAIYGVCAITAAISYQLKEHDRLRFLPAVLPLLTVPLAHDGILWVAPLIMTGYFIYIGISERYDTIFWEFQRLFFKGLILSVIITLCYMVMVNFYMQKKVYDEYLFLLGFVLLGSYILRILRLGTTKSWKVRVLNGAMLFGTLLLATVLAGGVTLLGLLDWSMIAEILLLPLGIILNAFANLVVLITRKPAKFYDKYDKIADKYAKNLPEQKPWGERRFEEKAQLITKDQMYANRVIAVLVIVGIIALVVILYFFIRYIRDHQRPNYYMGDQDTLSCEYDYYYEKARKKERSARGRLRNIYRQYLLYNVGQGIRIRQSDTSGDVMDKNEEAFGQRAEEKELRELYVKVRYSEDYEPTGSEVRRAKQLLKQLKAGK